MIPQMTVLAMGLRTGSWGSLPFMLPFHSTVTLELAPDDRPDLLVRLVDGIPSVPRELAVTDVVELDVNLPSGSPRLKLRPARAASSASRAVTATECGSSGSRGTPSSPCTSTPGSRRRSPPTTCSTAWPHSSRRHPDRVPGAGWGAGSVAPGRFSGVIELTRGQEMALATDDGRPLTRLRMGVGWDKRAGAGFIGSGAADVDLDGTAIQFAGGRLFDIAFYNHLATRDGSVVHLGDNISGRGEGDDEQLTVDLERVYAKVDTILFLVSSYQGHTLEWVDNAYCRLVDEDDVELARLTLTDGTPRTGLVLAKVFRDAEGWRLRAVGEGVAVTVPTESLDRLARFL